MAVNSVQSHNSYHELSNKSKKRKHESAEEQSNKCIKIFHSLGHQKLYNYKLDQDLRYEDLVQKLIEAHKKSTKGSKTSKTFTIEANSCSRFLNGHKPPSQLLFKAIHALIPTIEYEDFLTPPSSKEKIGTEHSNPPNINSVEKVKSLDSSLETVQSNKSTQVSTQGKGTFQSNKPQNKYQSSGQEKLKKYIMKKKITYDKLGEELTKISAKKGIVAKKGGSTTQKVTASTITNIFHGKVPSQPVCEAIHALIPTIDPQDFIGSDSPLNVFSPGHVKLNNYVREKKFNFSELSEELTKVSAREKISGKKEGSTQIIRCGTITKILTWGNTPSLKVRNAICALIPTIKHSDFMVSYPPSIEEEKIKTNRLWVLRDLSAKEQQTTPTAHHKDEVHESDEEDSSSSTNDASPTSGKNSSTNDASHTRSKSWYDVDDASQGCFRTELNVNPQVQLANKSENTLDDLLSMDKVENILSDEILTMILNDMK